MLNELCGWKQTLQGRNIDLIGNFSDWKSHHGTILFIGGVHGDEPEGVNIATSLAETLKSADLSKAKKFLIIPCLNADGFALKQRTNSRGVDINRNFPCKNWSAEYEKERYFPGEAPGSELETQAVIELVETVKPRIIIHFHSWKPMIVSTADS